MFVARPRPWILSAVIALIALIGALVSVPTVAHADAATGSGGLFSQANGRLFVSSGQLAANQWTTIKVQGVAGIPSSGVGAVQVAYIVYGASSDGSLYAGKSGETPSTSIPSALYSTDAVTKVSIVPVGADGSIQVMTTSRTQLAVDVQGYYGSGTPAAGGFVATASTALSTVPANTVYGAGQTMSFGLGGSVPSNAGAVVLNVIAYPQDDTAGGWIAAYTAGGSSSGAAQLNWPAGQDTSWTAIVKTPSSAGGKAAIQIGPRGKVKLAVSVIGYYAATSTTWKAGTFVPAQTTVLDTRTSGDPIPSSKTKTIKVAGVAGVPPVGSGMQYVALSVRLYPQAFGHTQMYASDDAAGKFNAEFTGNMSVFTMLPIGPDGAITISNISAKDLNVGVDVQGWFSSLPEGPRAGNDFEGARTSATNLPFPITDQTSTQVDVGTGNLQLNIDALSLPGVTSSVPIGASYNSRGWRTAVDSLPTANRWNYGFAAAGDLSANGSGVEWTDATGATWQFRPGTGAGVYTSPAGLQMTLTLTNSGYTLKSWTSNQTINFDLGGNATSVVDRNNNKVTINRNGGNVTSVVTTAGPTAARTLNTKYDNGTFMLTQGSGSAIRSISFVKDSSGNITSYTDATGKKTTFAYSGSDLTSITAPTGGVTAFTYDSSDRVTKVTQSNSTAGSPGTAVTRFSYVSDTVTQVADPRSDQSATVANTKHTEYTLNSNDLVIKTVDPMGRERSKTYNSANNGVASSQVGAAGGASTGTSSNKYDKNSGQSLTSSQSGSGSTSSAEYGSTSPAATYLPSKVTSGSSSSTSMAYDDYGNQTSSQSGPAGAVAKLDYNGDGTIRQATAPGNSGNPTKYEYTNKQLTKITAPTGSSIGVKEYTYDDFGRVKTETDGRGNTTTFGYDNDDRPTSTSFSDGTQTVTNTYDGNGNQTSQVSAGGTITNSYDQRNRLIATSNTAGGGQVSYGYDLAGNTVKVTDAQGTVTHDYDSSGALTATTYPSGAGTAKQLYKTDSNSGRRTDTWMNAVPNADSAKDPETWEARQHVEYDKSGKITRIQAWGDEDRSKPIVDVTYCYVAGTTPGSSCDANSANDRDKLQWTKDNTTGEAASGQVTTYGYKGDDDAETDRLTSVVQSGGADPTNWTFTYDDNGNRTRATARDVGTNTVKSDTQLSYNSVGQITTAGYEYDGTGNLTKAPGQTFTYNGAQQLTASTKDGKTTRYTYAGASMVKMLSQATDGGQAYQYTYGTTDRNGVPVLAARGAAGSGTASVMTDPKNNRPLNLRTADGATSMWVIDGIGNQVAAITDKGTKAYTVRYDPYGTETVSFGDTSAQWKQNPFGFKAGLRSSSTDNGLTKFGYRWQSSVTGGWAQRDTLDAPLDPTNANRYAFAGTDPINNSDPAGRSALGVIADILDALSTGQSIGQVINGMTSAERLSFLAGGVFAGACYSAALLLGVATSGAAGVPAGIFCAAVGQSASMVYDRLYG